MTICIVLEWKSVDPKIPKRIAKVASTPRSHKLRPLRALAKAMEVAKKAVNLFHSSKSLQVPNAMMASLVHSKMYAIALELAKERPSPIVL